MRGSIKRHSSYYLYMLQCADGTYYTGYTNNLESRVKLHNSGNGAKSLKWKGKLPVELVYAKEYRYYKRALKETEHILAKPKHPKFNQRMVHVLSRCDKPRELFSILSQAKFIQAWPGIRSFWQIRVRRSESRDWWQTIYEQLMEEKTRPFPSVKGKLPDFFWFLAVPLKRQGSKRE
jgi:putative endonuclease